MLSDLALYHKFYEYYSENMVYYPFQNQFLTLIVKH